jgi:LAO/AO transport system kinase
VTAEEIIEKILAGDVRQAARLMRDLDDGRPQALEIMKRLYHSGGRTQVWGITGSPGVGKSTLTDALLTRLRQQGKTVGVVAVDPTSPFTGGAILGDRVRMQRHATDEGVFIRSLATRGHFGGLTASTRGVVTVMEAMGKDVVLVETVGVGQDEIDVARMADTTVIVTVPGLGDEVQAIKAGILEAGDIFVVNKMDREGANNAINQLESMLALERRGTRGQGWTPPVVPTCAVDGRGLEDLMKALADHHRYLDADNGRILKLRRLERARMELLDLIQTRVMEHLIAKLESMHRLEEIAEDIAAGKSDPYSECDEVIAALLPQ